MRGGLKGRGEKNIRERSRRLARELIRTFPITRSGREQKGTGFNCTGQ